MAAQGSRGSPGSEGSHLARDSQTDCPLAGGCSQRAQQDLHLAVGAHQEVEVEVSQHRLCRHASLHGPWLPDDDSYPMIEVLSTASESPSGAAHLTFL